MAGFYRIMQLLTEFEPLLCDSFVLKKSFTVFAFQVAEDLKLRTNQISRQASKFIRKNPLILSNRSIKLEMQIPFIDTRV